MKKLFIAEKPSVAQEFASALEMKAARRDGYLESEEYIVTWCVGHLVTMSYPEAYDPVLKKWQMDTLPFIPDEFRYEIIPGVRKQFETVASLLKRPDVACIYVCTDSGREGEYIYRLVDMMADVGEKEKRRVWIDSQTKEEILRGIREAKPLSAYDHLASSAFLRAREDYLMGINFSRALTLRYGNQIARRIHEPYTVISAGRVMTCVLGMIVRREREIRMFRKTVFYKLNGMFSTEGELATLQAEFRAKEYSQRYCSGDLYKDSGFLSREKAEEISALFQPLPCRGKVSECERKKENKNPPLLYNLAELQNDCAKLYKINPDECLKIAQELYEKKLTTYPRTDARVLSSAVAKEIRKNLEGLKANEAYASFVDEIFLSGAEKKIVRSRYTDDRKITDHYAIIPTGQGLHMLQQLKPLSRQVYDLIVRRFLSVFYPPAVYQKLSVRLEAEGEQFVASAKVLINEGYLKVVGKNREETAVTDGLEHLKKGQTVYLKELEVKEGETSPPKHYTSGSMILAMENAGSLIEDEELRAQIKGSGIGTSATRAEILKKLVNIRYVALNQKTQILTPTELGELVTDAVYASIRQLLNPELTASWEKGLSYVANGEITEAEYMEKLNAFVRNKTQQIKGIRS